MLQNRDAVVKPYGFLIAVELEDPSLIEEVVNAIVDSVRFMERTGRVDVELLGELEEVADGSDEV